MDPLAAIGLAGNIVQFLDLGEKLVSGAVELYNASDGATSTNRVLEQTSTDLYRLCNELKQRAEKFHGYIWTEPEGALLPLVQSCSELGEEFIAILEDLKVKGRHKILKSAFKAMKTAWKMKDIRQYEGRLNLYRSQIATRLLSILNDKQDFNFALNVKTHEQQAGLRETLSQLKESHKALEIQATNRAAQLEEIIVTSLRETANPCPNLATLLTHLESESLNLRKQIQIIESLRFPEIFERADNIKEAHPATFEWLFDGKSRAVSHRQQSNIFDWLRTGNGTFWVSGKAGSGKSTLMKFFCNHHKTTAALKYWATGSKIVVASFFFWNAGTRLQKSQQGLLQTLLLHVFKQDPALVAVLCPHKWQRSAIGKEPWTWTDLLDALANLKAHRTDTLKFCFFIDGLDEYDGEHVGIIKILESLVCSPSIKICFSSRPWNVFETFYGKNSGQKLYLHELTHDDITRFTRDELAIGTQFSSQRSMRRAYRALVEDIVDRARGVFLWVFLVVRSLRRGMTNFDTPSELQVRLLELPTELEELFQHILDTSEQVYQTQAARIYLIQLIGAEQQLGAVDVAFFADGDIDFAQRDDMTSQLASNLESIADSTRIRILARCKDLSEFDAHGRLQFLHRTVRDFLETSDIHQQLEKRAGEFFNAHHFMCNSMVLQLRMIAEYPCSVNYSIHAPFEDLINCFWHHVRLSDPRSSYRYSLFPALDRVLWTLFNSLARNMSCAASPNSIEFGSLHYEGLVIDQAADVGVLEYLSSKIGHTIDIIQKDGHVIQKLPLEIAFEHMRSEKRNEVIRHLLDQGANPNEKCTSGTSVWQKLIKNLRLQSKPALSNQDIDILSMLIHAGADIGTDELRFLSEQHYTPRNVVKPNNLGLGLECSA